VKTERRYNCTMNIHTFSNSLWFNGVLHLSNIQSFSYRVIYSI
jgi:hypothetical protein